MKQKTLKNIIILSILLIGILISNTVFAAGSFTVDLSTVTIKEGKTTTFTIDGTNATGRVNITSSDSAVATVSSASTWLEKNSSIITITGKKAGTATITVSGKVSDEKGAEATITKNITVTVKAEETSNGGGTTNQNTNTNTNSGTTNNNTSTNTNTNTNTNSSSNSGTTTTTKSTNAYLSTLGVRLSESVAKQLGVETDEYDFSGFKKATLTYNVTVPYEVDSLKVSYKAADSNATVKVTGNSGFEVGSSNKITIKVTAEDGKTTKTYTIKVTKLAEEEEKPGNIIEDEVPYLTSLSIEGIDIYPEFTKDIYAYTATLEEDVSEVEVVATANKENASIEISGNTNLVLGENTINIVVKQDESMAQTVYQIVLNKEQKEIISQGDTNLISNIMNNMTRYIIIAVVVVVAMIITVIILIVLLKKEDKELEEEEILEVNSNEYDVYKNDESEFENKDKEIIEETKAEDISIKFEENNEVRRSRRREKGKHSK